MVYRVGYKRLMRIKAGTMEPRCRLLCVRKVHLIMSHKALLDKKGAPLVLLHGTCRPLDHFDPAKVGSSHNTPDDSGSMFFFTNDKKAASWYAHSACDRHGGAPHLIEVRLHMKNPKVVDFQETGVETLFEDIDSARAAGHDGLITLNYDDGGIIDQFIAFHHDAIEIIGVSKLPSKSKKRMAKVDTDNCVLLDIGNESVVYSCEKSTMNRVSTVVKNAMLGAPGLFPTRMSVLSFIFLNSGGGYHWSKKGEPDCIYGMPKPAEKMNMADLNELIACTKETGITVGIPEKMNFQLAELKLQKLRLKHVADNIELYAQHPSDAHANVKISDIPILSTNSNLAGTLLGALDEPKKLDKDWAEAADEVAWACLKAVKTATADGSLPPQMKQMEASLSNALVILEPITHRRANMAKAALALSGMWDDYRLDKALGM